MSPTRTSAANLAVLLALVIAGAALWMLHARAWDLGRRSPILGYDPAQYALAARELSDHGRLATTFALPIELVRHARPPWPLAVVQPGLVIAEAIVFRLTPHARAPHQREWETLIVPVLSFLALGILLALLAAWVLERHAPGTSPLWRRLAALTIGLAFLLDPEAQHFAIGGFTELPFTLGLIAAVALLAGESAARRPLLFGLLLGMTGSFRVSMVWLAPVFALGAAALAPGRRLRVASLAMLGYALVLLPWWVYKWRAFGDPGWDLSRLVLWEGVQGRSWFSLFHLPEMPALPHGLEAARLIGAKIAQRLPLLLSALAAGPRALWIGALILWAATCRPPRALGVTAWVIVLAGVLGVLSAAASIPWLRFLFPARIALEAAGVLALWGLISNAPVTMVGPQVSRVLRVGVAVLSLGWGVTQTIRGQAEARTAAAERGVPDVLTLRQLGDLLQREAPGNEVVMSNLGPMLAWNAARPILHLALTPADVSACRRRLEFRHVLLAFRDPAQAWPGWQEVMERPAEATAHPEWNVVRERHWQERDGFQVVWLELGPPEVRVAENGIGVSTHNGRSSVALRPSLRATELRRDASPSSRRRAPARPAPRPAG